MHVAICDDNVADRKHLERLLSRESDKRAGTPNILYVDSYGEKMHFLANPLKYNLIFMDMSSEPGIVEFILEHLEEMGYHAPLVLYSDKIDYTALPNLPDYVVHARKPYIPDPLPEFLALGDANVSGHVVSISVHKNSVLIHVPKYMILYALEGARTCTLYLTDNVADEVLRLPLGASQHDIYKAIGLMNAEGDICELGEYTLDISGRYDLNQQGVYHVSVRGVGLFGVRTEKNMMLCVG